MLIMKQPHFKNFSVFNFYLWNPFCSVKLPKPSYDGLGSRAPATCQSQWGSSQALKFGFISTVKPPPQDGKPSLTTLNQKYGCPKTLHLLWWIKFCFLKSSKWCNLASTGIRSDQVWFTPPSLHTKSYSRCKHRIMWLRHLHRYHPAIRYGLKQICIPLPSQEHTGAAQLSAEWQRGALSPTIHPLTLQHTHSHPLNQLAVGCDPPLHQT